jgi:predicted nuclease of restriction endonuclease-like (RecB) superfamily
LELYAQNVLTYYQKGVLEDNLKKYHFPEKPEDIIKDPYILEFLGLDEKTNYTENDLEQAIIDKLEHFLLEM